MPHLSPVEYGEPVDLQQFILINDPIYIFAHK